MESPAVMVKRFQALQEERVRTYKLFDEGFQCYLATAPSYDFVAYRQMVHEVTQTFNSLSQHIIEIQNTLSQQESLANIAARISNIQTLEKNKLEQTAQLQFATQNVTDHPHDAVCVARVTDLKQVLAKTISDINEQLDELKYEAEEILCSTLSAS